MSRSRKNFIKDMHMEKGALHKKLGVPDNKKIPEKKIEKATHSKSSTLRKEAVLAETLRGLRRKHA